MITAMTSQFANPGAPIAALGLILGTEVMTMTGIRPVEALRRGDRIVTRTGSRVLRDVIRTTAQHFQLVFDKPQVVFVVDGQVHCETGQPFAA